MGEMSIVIPSQGTGGVVTFVAPPFIGGEMRGMMPYRSEELRG